MACGDICMPSTSYRCHFGGLQMATGRKVSLCRLLSLQIDRLKTLLAVYGAHGCESDT